MVNGESPFMVTTTATGARYQLPVRPQVAWIGTVRVAMGCLGVAATLQAPLLCEPVRVLPRQ